MQNQEPKIMKSDLTGDYYIVTKYKDLWGWEMEAKEKFDITDQLKKLWLTPLKIDWNTSDWHHTFNELYEHRFALFIALMRSHPERSWRAYKHADGAIYPWWFIAGIRLPNWTITYHLPVNKREELDDWKITTMANAPERDGHTSNDVIERLKNFYPQQKTND